MSKVVGLTVFVAICLQFVVVSAELENIPFLFGANPGAPPANWNDAKQAVIASYAGVNTYRVWLPENYLDQWGYDIAFATGAMGTYAQVGFINMVGNVNTPISAHSNAPTEGMEYAYSPTNLNEPIWLQNGEVNPNNYWALYVNKTATTYKDHIKIWEVWNEPDFVGDWQKPLLWYDNDPVPSDLVNWHDTIQAYNRLMRITWEVARKVDPTAHVAVGGLGYPSFLDAMLRNTDGSGDGQTGGNYFDTLSFHFYPVFYNKDNSDAWADLFVQQIDEMMAVCKSRSFTPAVVICTESGAPTVATTSAPGSNEIQRNYFTKMSVLGQAKGVSQIHWWSLVDDNGRGSDDPFRSMGLYTDISQLTVNTTVPKPSTVAMRTYTKLLRGFQYYDSTVDILVDLPSTIRGYAFTNGSNVAVVIWANNNQTSNEGLSVQNTFSTTCAWIRKDYDWDSTRESTILTPVNGELAMTVTTTPIFLLCTDTVNIPLGSPNANPNPSTNPSTNPNAPRSNSPGINSGASSLFTGFVLFSSVVALFFL